MRTSFKAPTRLSFGSASGFTLVETIVTIAVLAILATVAFVSFSGYRGSAVDSKRLTDIKNISSSISSYIETNGKAPVPSNAKTITYSGAVAWNQGVIDSPVLSQLGNLPSDIKDPTYGKYYSYSVLNNSKEFQIGGVIQSQEGASAFVPSLLAVFAEDLTKPLALVDGNYNGILAKVRSGNACDTLALPSILLSDISTTELINASSGVVVINDQKNIPATYIGSSVYYSGAVLFRPFSDPLVSLVSTRTCDYDTIKSDASLQTLATNIQNAYLGTVVATQADAPVVRVTQDITTSVQKQELGKEVIVNVLGETLNPDEGTDSMTDSCSLQPNVISGTGYYVGAPSSPNQPWSYWNGVGPQPACSFTCEAGASYDGTNCIKTRMYLCSGKPSNSYWTTTNSLGYTQTWNGSSWSPVDAAPVYNTTPDPTGNSCYYSCVGGYHKNPSAESCDLDTQACSTGSCTGTQTWNSGSNAWNSCYLTGTGTGGYYASADGSKCIKDCTAGAQTVNGHTYSVPAIFGLSTTSVVSQAASATPVCAGNTIKYRQSFQCSADGAVSLTGSETNESIVCGSNYSVSGWTCAAASNTASCGALPANTTNNSPGTLTTYSQTWGCSAWTPTKSWTYSAGGGAECNYKCATGYHWNSGSSICDADVISCAPPTGASAASQTWNGSAYGACLATACNANYTLSAGACSPNTQVAACAALGAGMMYVNSTANYSFTQTWNGSVFAPPTTQSYAASPAANTCQYACTATYNWTGAACAPRVNCVGSWGVCSNGSQTYSITTAASNGGTACSYANGATQGCGTACVGSWGACSGGSQTYNVTTPAAGGGTNCPYANGATQSCGTTGSCSATTGQCAIGSPINLVNNGCGSTTNWVCTGVSGGANVACSTNNAPCPINCVGSWSNNATCSATCGGGVLQQVYSITTAAANGGTACPYANGATQWGGTSCNTQGCPVNCVGSWVDNSTCSASCGGGVKQQVFTVTTAAANGGAACAYANGATRWGATSCNTQGCPVNCVGSWSNNATCSATCGGGVLQQVYSITTAAANGGAACPYGNGATQWGGTSCNTQGCPQNCTYSTTGWSACSKACGSGTQSYYYTITSPAKNGGTCPVTEGQIVGTQSCNTQACPVNCSYVSQYSPTCWYDSATCSDTCNTDYCHYHITTAASNGGTCGVTEGQLDGSNACLATLPTSCSYTQTNWSACSGSCENAQQTFTYHITSPATNGGSCPVTEGQIGSQGCTISSSSCGSWVADPQECYVWCNGTSGASAPSGSCTKGAQTMDYSCIGSGHDTGCGYWNCQ